MAPPGSRHTTTDSTTERPVGTSAGIATTAGSFAGLLAAQHGHERRDKGRGRGDAHEPPEEPTPGGDVREAVGHGAPGRRSSPMADPAGFYCDCGVGDEMRAPCPGKDVAAA